MAEFEIIGRITDRETIARGGGIRDLADLREDYGDSNWRKCKGEAIVEVKFVKPSCIGMRRTASESDV